MDNNSEEYRRYEENQEDAIDRLRKGPKRWMNLSIIMINIVMFALVEITGSSLDSAHMVRWGAAYTPLISGGQYFRLFTCMFLHFGLDHLINNMLLLVFIGDYLEKTVGKFRYLLIYLIGGMGGSVVSWLYYTKSGEVVVSAGASGAVFAIIGALIYVLLVNRGHLDDLSLKRVFLMAALSIYVGFRSQGIDNSAHVGGLICGFLMAVLLYRKDNKER